MTPGPQTIHRLHRRPAGPDHTPLVTDCVPAPLTVVEEPFRGAQGGIEVGTEERLLELLRHRRQTGLLDGGDGPPGLSEFLLQLVTAPAQPSQEHLGLVPAGPRPPQFSLCRIQLVGEPAKTGLALLVLFVELVMQGRDLLLQLGGEPAETQYQLLGTAPLLDQLAVALVGLLKSFVGLRGLVLGGGRNAGQRRPCCIVLRRGRPRGGERGSRLRKLSSDEQP
ncbi:hypothetical protein [Streptomyces sp. NPDC101237]|uniref:hypothetical protein n=1 Tax=Streptomyces sp. NPDC101237 TaxID=3366139 RepID=UPI00380E4D49